MIHTKSWYNDNTDIQRSEVNFSDLGYALAIPWNDIYTTGWANNDPKMMKVWGTENKIVMSDKPEYYAPGDLIRSNVLPAINPQDPIYSFSRAEHQYTLF